MIRRDEQGLTIVELLISIVITGLLVGIVMMFTISNLSGFSATSIKQNLMAQAQSGLNTINDSTLLAGAADTTNRIADSNGPGGPSNLFGWVGNNQTLILATVAEDASGNILFSDPSQYVSYKNNIIYYLDGTTLRKRTLAASVTGNKAKTTCPDSKVTASCKADPIILENVSAIAFTYFDKTNASVTADNARSVEINVTMKDKRFSRKTQVQYKTRTVFRND